MKDRIQISLTLSTDTVEGKALKALKPFLVILGKKLEKLADKAIEYVDARTDLEIEKMKESEDKE